MLRVASLLVLSLLLAGCGDGGFKLGRDNPHPGPGWVGHTVADFAARNPNAKPVYESGSLFVFEKKMGYGSCEITLFMTGETISDVVNGCPPGTLWLSPPLTRAAQP